ncbi:MAG TPA: acyl carrier protein [Bacteroidia bacterium]|nr:acyl carrier protein [Bacteroidia bacterium]
MDIGDFIKKIENEIEEITPGVLKADTNYRNIPGWSSMHALIIIALIDTEYNVTITGSDIRGCQTVNDLFTIVKSRV